MGIEIEMKLIRREKLETLVAGRILEGGRKKDPTDKEEQLNETTTH
jgi:hypothetical protein